MASVLQVQLVSVERLTSAYARVEAATLQASEVSSVPSPIGVFW